MKVYEKHWNSLAARAGERTVWALPFPSEARIKKIVLVQVGGTDVTSFSLDIFNSKRVLRGSQSSGGDDPDGDYSSDPDLYRACSTFVVTGNKLKQFYHDSGGIVFSNQDGGSTNKERKVYLEIEIPAGSGDTTWDLALTAITDVG